MYMSYFVYLEFIYEILVQLAFLWINFHHRRKITDIPVVLSALNVEGIQSTVTI